MLPRPDALTLIQRIAARRDGDHSLDALSRRAGWSKFHLQRGLRRMLGESPKQYTHRLRLEHAATLLISTRNSARSIAWRSGFRSPEVFSRAFRRYFGRTPIQYRNESLAGLSGPARRRHARLTLSVGPCVGLYHVRQPVTGASTMTPPLVERRMLEAQPIVFIRRSVAQTQLAALFAECFPKVFMHCQQAGLAMAGNPIARYVETGPGLWTVDCAIPLIQAGTGDGEVETGELPAGLAAFAVHRGAYDTLPETNATIDRWIHSHGHERSGPTWEAYVTDPAEHPDPSDWRTEVYWPISA